jgi:hypothetical protein
MDMTKAKAHELKWAKTLNLPKGSFARFDRGFTDYCWYNDLTENGIFFVTRLKSNAQVEYLRHRAGRKSSGISNDQSIRLKGIKKPLRLVCYTDPETGINYRFVSNAHHLKAKEIAEIYRERWQIELFFKWIKQNPRIKTFLGLRPMQCSPKFGSPCASICWSLFSISRPSWAALCSKMLRLLQLNLFERRNVIGLFKPPEKQPIVSTQLLLFQNL